MKTTLIVIFMVTFILSVIGLGHFVLYKSILNIFNITNIRNIHIVQGSLFFGAVSFVVMNLIVQIGYSKLGSFLYGLSAVWLGTLYFLFLASVVFFLILGVNNFIGLPSYVIRIIGATLLVFAVGVSIYGVIHSFKINVTNYTLKINNLPEDWNNKNIVMFADTHFGNIRNVHFGKRLVDKINEQNGEAVLIAGDYYDGPPVNVQEIGMLMSQVKSTKGVFFAPGNHEDYGKREDFINSLKEAHVTVLLDSLVNIDGVQIAGVDYDSGSTKDKLDITLNKMGINKDLPKILIKHAPTNLISAKEKNFDLVVSGHTHKGQMWPGPWITKKMFKEFYYGLNYLNSMAVVTTSGVGTWGPPQRVGTNSEIVVIRLENK